MCRTIINSINQTICGKFQACIEDKRKLQECEQKRNGLLHLKYEVIEENSPGASDGVIRQVAVQRAASRRPQPQRKRGGPRALSPASHEI